VRAAFKVLGPKISALLDQKCDAVPSSSQLIFDVFMIGKVSEASIPHVMFSCKKPDPRKTAMRILKQSALLEDYPGFETGHWQFPPHILNPRPLARIRIMDNAILHPSNLYLDVLSKPDTQDEFDPSVAALGLYTRGPLFSMINSLTATVGGVILSGDQQLFLTVAHALDPHELSSCEDEDDDDSSDFEFGGFTEGGLTVSDDVPASVGGDDTVLEATNSELERPGSRISEFSSWGFDLAISDSPSQMESKTPYRSTTSGAGKNKEEILPTPLYEAGRYRSSLHLGILESPDLDYALVEAIDHPYIPWNNLPIISWRSMANFPSDDIPMITTTASTGLISGVLHSDISYVKFSSSLTFQEVFTVTLNGPLCPGDSGAVVLGEESRKVYGHIVAGSIESHVAYVIPAINVLRDLDMWISVVEESNISEKSSLTPRFNSEIEVSALIQNVHVQTQDDKLDRLSNLITQHTNRQTLDSAHNAGPADTSPVAERQQAMPGKDSTSGKRVADLDSSGEAIRPNTGLNRDFDRFHKVTSPIPERPMLSSTGTPFVGQQAKPPPLPLWATKLPQTELSKWYWRYTWCCCNCRRAAYLNCELDSYCPACYVGRCPNCTVEANFMLR
jgi:hypothetical protein